MFLKNTTINLPDSKFHVFTKVSSFTLDSLECHTPNSCGVAQSLNDGIAIFLCNPIHFCAPTGTPNVMSCLLVINEFLRPYMQLICSRTSDGRRMNDPNPKPMNSTVTGTLFKCTPKQGFMGSQQLVSVHISYSAGSRPKIIEWEI